MLGTVTIEIQLAPASILMLGTTITNNDVTAANNTPSKGEVNRAAPTTPTGQRTISLAAEAADYTLTNLEF